MDTTTTTGAGGTSQGGGGAASGVAGTAKEAVGHTATQARDAAGQVAGEAADGARNVAGQGRDRIRGEVDRRSTEFGERATGTADDLRSIGGQLREQGNDQPARLADGIADGVERVGRYLRDADPDAMLRDVERAARQRPWAVIAGGMAAGFVASRMLRASSSGRYGQDRGRSTDTTTPTTAFAGTTPGAATGSRAGDPGAGRAAGTPLEGLATQAERTPGAQPPAGTDPWPSTAAAGGGPQSRGVDAQRAARTAEGSVSGERSA